MDKLGQQPTTINNTAMNTLGSRIKRIKRIAMDFVSQKLPKIIQNPIAQSPS